MKYDLDKEKYYSQQTDLLQLEYAIFNKLYFRLRYDDVE